MIASAYTYDSPNGCVVAPSIEAKTYGVKTGMTVRDAHILCPGVIVRTPNPDMYWAVHRKETDYHILIGSVSGLIQRLESAGVPVAVGFVRVSPEEEDDDDPV